MSNSNKVEVVPIKLEKHPNADSLSIVKVWGYQVVVKTEEWRGEDRAAYLPPDSVVPDTEEYEFLGNNKRIKTRKFRGEISHGMLVPAPKGSRVGDDVTEALGITFYEHPSESTSGKGYSEFYCHGPSVSKYDIEAWHKFGKDVFKFGEEVIVTEKIHGTNARFTTHTFANSDAGPYPEFIVGSRKNWMHTFKKEKTKPRAWLDRLKNRFGLFVPQVYEKFNKSWWVDVIKFYPEIIKFCFQNRSYILYGEIFGQRVQKLDYGIAGDKLGFRVFDIYNKASGMFLDWDDMEAKAKEFGLPVVPVLYRGAYSPSVVRDYVDGKSHIETAKHHREGIVIRTPQEHLRRHRNVGRSVLKCISDTYYEKDK